MQETAVLICGFLFTTSVAIIVCYRLAAPNVGWHARITTIVAWSASYFIILLFPADLATTLTHNAEVGRGVYEGIWRFAYWNTQIMSNLLVPFQQSYVAAGEFTAKTRLKRFGKENLRKLIIGLVVAVIGFIIIVAKYRYLLKFSSLLSLLIGLGNMYGLVFCVLLLGYGCVEIPRHLWYYGDMDRLLKASQYRAVTVDAAITDARSRLAMHSSRALQAEQLIPEGHALRRYIDVVVKKIPSDFDLDSAASLMDANEMALATWRQDDNTFPKLVQLHRDMKDAVLSYIRANNEWTLLVGDAVEAQDVISNSGNTTKIFHSSVRPQRVGNRAALDGLEWWWKCRLRQPLCRGVACLFMLMSVIVVWSEVTMFTTRSLSPFGLLLSQGESFMAVQMIAALPLAYMVACAYFTLYKIRLFSLYQLHPNRQTDAYSLLFNAGYVARISSALCYNYINMLNLSDDLPLTGFERIMGPALRFFGSFSEAFNFYFPMFIGVFFVLNVFNVPRRILARFGLSKLLTNTVIDEDQLEEGARLLAQGAPRGERREARARGARGARGTPSSASAFTYDRHPSSSPAMLLDDGDDLPRDASILSMASTLSTTPVPETRSALGSLSAKFSSALAKTKQGGFFTFEKFGGGGS
eukprot:tig00001366_g8389.t1